MEAQLEQFLRPGTFVVVIAVYVLSFFTARIVHTALPWWRAKKEMTSDGKEVVRTKRYPTKLAMWWNEVMLPAVPVLYGAVLGFATSSVEFLWGPAAEQLSVCVMIGGGLGWFTTFLYKIARKLILQKAGVDIKPGSVPPETSPRG